MINFQRLPTEQKAMYEELLFATSTRGCGYSFASLFCWGIQKAAFIENCISIFAHYDGQNVYAYPFGTGDKKKVLEAILQDAADREIPCQINGLLKEDCDELESLFPGQFYFKYDRDGSDYVYDIEDLAELKGRKFQKKRNHVNRFQLDHPDYKIVPLDSSNMAEAREMVASWYIARKARDPHGDYLMESTAINRAMRNFEALGMEGIVLMDEGRILAVTMGSRLSPDTIDVHYEKAAADSDGAYAMINREFARYIREHHPEIRYLDREEDMGLEGLRRAKLSYNPHHMSDKYTAILRKDIFTPEDEIENA